MTQTRCIRLVENLRNRDKKKSHLQSHSPVQNPPLFTFGRYHLPTHSACTHGPVVSHALFQALLGTSTMNRTKEISALTGLSAEVQQGTDAQRTFRWSCQSVQRIQVACCGSAWLGDGWWSGSLQASLRRGCYSWGLTAKGLPARSCGGVGKNIVGRDPLR